MLDPRPMPVRRKSDANRTSLQRRKRQSVGKEATYSVPSFLELAPRSGVASAGGSRSSIVVKEGERITAANFEGLVEQLLEDGHKDETFVEAFVATHSYFADTHSCLTYLMERFYDGNETAIFHLFKTWLRHYYEDFEEEMGLLFNMFLSDVRTKGGAYEAQAEELSRVMQESRQFYEQNLRKKVKRRDTNLFGIETRIPSIASRWTAKEMACQLTLAQYDQFRKVPLREFLHKAWSKSSRKDTRLEIKALIQKANDVSFWAATAIVTPEKKKRKKMLRLFIQVAEECIGMQNFETAMQLFSALNLRPVERMEHWKMLSKGTVSKWEAIQTFFNPMSNFKPYRSALKTIKPPAIPLLSLVLSDLTMLEENQSKLDTEEIKKEATKKGSRISISVVEPEKKVDSGKNATLIHFDKMQMIFSTLRTVNKCLSVPYDIKRTTDKELEHMVVQLPGITETELYAIKDEKGERMTAAWRKDLKKYKKSKKKNKKGQGTKGEG